MTEQEASPSNPTENPHRGVDTTRQFKVNGGDLSARVVADWLDIHDQDKPRARMFHTAYLAEDAGSDRPVIFCINGGPGASSVFLQFACVGPKAVARDDNGLLDGGNRELLDNPDSWLAFADLVFIDPIGTGFSHLIEAEPKEGEDKPKEGSDKSGEHPYWTTSKDLDSIGQFMRRFLRQHKMWRRPLYFAGESYGGYRACRMAKRLHKDYGLGTAGIISISPIWQFRDVSGSDFSTSQWVNQLPTYAAIAHENGTGRYFARDTDMDTVLAEAEQFSINDYVRVLVAGYLMPDAEREEILNTVADMMGLDRDFVSQSGGRISMHDYGRLVRQEHGEIVDLYDGSQYSLDPFPHRTNNEEAIGNALFHFFHVFDNALHQWFFEELGVETPLEYKLLNMEAHKQWKNDEKQLDLFELPSSVDDFRAGLSGNPDMRALIVHGRYDMVTPYFASRRILNQINLDDRVQDRIEERLYEGGHMFYSWPHVNAEFARDVKVFVGGGK